MHYGLNHDDDNNYDYYHPLATELLDCTGHWLLLVNQCESVK